MHGVERTRGLWTEGCRRNGGEVRTVPAGVCSSGPCSSQCTLMPYLGKHWLSRPLLSCRTCAGLQEADVRGRTHQVHSR